ncbi:MAG TPA: hypothetical protein VMT15_19625 [Bryobacteraceae bacterium]|nr:hypothetical protein [Bryobacteraceae bacterium]
MTKERFQGVAELDVRDSVAVSKQLWIFVTLLVGLLIGVLPVYGQTTFEVTPLVGGRFFGTFNLHQEGQTNQSATMGDSLSYGVSAGFRFDGEDCQKCSVVGFRWMRQSTHLALQSPATASPQPAVTLDHFLSDFTHEFPIEGTQDRVKPFLMGSLGGVLMSTPVESRIRFEFGIGAGLNVFPKPRWGFRLQVEYLPILKYAGVQKLVCGAGGCVGILYGGLMNQLVVSAGPIFRF